tara:strand:+ start:665 stop:811 length:147 start_codon:yes stop_codon:yes gene_type:complete
MDIKFETIDSKPFKTTTTTTTTSGINNTIHNTTINEVLSEGEKEIQGN